jgi:TolA-binding protein
LYGLKKYEPAVAQYDIVLQKYPESDTSKSALLKKGLAQAELNPQQAITTLNEVLKRYPNTSESQSAQVKIKELQPARAKPPAR